ncbi:hypothetical protein HYT02_05015 [Candidatus Gottesmanbacteria bacterium]|nr:hypothetical protein [Candidatus Gottesmanbacteria bacterium]
MKLKTTLIAFLLVFTFIISSTNVFAAPGCCGDSRLSLPQLQNSKICFTTTTNCNAYPNNGQTVSLKSCDSVNNVPETGIVEYNSDCFVNIQAPTEVKITDFGRLFSGAVSFLLLIAFILAFFYLILGGISWLTSWLTSGGDKANIETARNKIIAAIIGLIIVAATWALFQLIGGAIGFNILGGFELPTLY